MLVEKLSLFTGLDEKFCAEKLNNRSNNFWLALYDLSVSEKDKIQQVDKLQSATDAEIILNTLSSLEKIYDGESFSKLKRKIYDTDKSFWEKIGNPSGKEGLYEIAPESREMRLYTSLLRSSEKQIILSTLKIIRSISITYFNNELTDQLNILMTGTDYNIANEAIRTVCDDPEKINLFLQSLQFNLEPSRISNHFMAVRAFWSENAKIYSEIIPLLEGLSASSNSQVRDMSQEVLIRYGHFNDQDVIDRNTKYNDIEMSTIRRIVSKISSVKSLYNFADEFNWDENIEFMKAVIKHKKCETAIARLIYWRSSPTYFQKYTSVEQVEEYHREIFNLQLEIEEKIEKGVFPTGKLLYNPKDDYGEDRTICDLSKRQIKRPIPAFMYN